MDYDQTTLAATFDAARGYSPDVLRLWLKRVAVHAPPAPQVILDSCGTGRFTHPLTERFRARGIGIDPCLQRSSQRASQRCGPTRHSTRAAVASSNMCICS